jgi:hypothetical protein
MGEEITQKNRRALTSPPFFVINSNRDIKESFAAYLVTLPSQPGNQAHFLM